MITAVIIAKNEEEIITGAIKSILPLTRNILLIDDYSSDKTPLIAKKYNLQLLQPPKGADFSQKRNTALPKISTDWILYLDADERLTPELVAEIKKTVSDPHAYSAYWIDRKNYILGRQLKSKTWSPDSQPRLFKTHDFKGWTGHIHESANYLGEKGNLLSPMLHLTHRTVASMITKANEWSEIEAENLYNSNHPKITSLRLIKIFITQFFKSLISERQFKNGIRGLIESFLQTNSVMITYFKLWEKQQDPSIKQLYKDLDK